MTRFYKKTFLELAAIVESTFRHTTCFRHLRNYTQSSSYFKHTTQKIKFTCCFSIFLIACQVGSTHLSDICMQCYCQLSACIRRPAPRDTAALSALFQW